MKRSFRTLARTVAAAFLCAGLVLAGAPGALADAETAATEPNEDARAARVIGDVFLRSMANWSLKYRTLKTKKAGVACIPWDAIDLDFVKTGEFKGLGFSYSTAKHDYAVKVATEGCQRMAAGLKLDDCVCQTVMLDDRPVVFVPTAVRDRLGLE